MSLPRDASHQAQVDATNTGQRIADWSDSKVPDFTLVLHQLIDELCDITAKTAAVQLYIQSCIQYGMPVDQAYSSAYYSLLLGATTACGAVINTPKALGGSQAYSRILQSVLCGLVPSVISRLELIRQGAYEAYPASATEHNSTSSASGSSTTLVDATLTRFFERAYGMLRSCESASPVTLDAKHASNRLSDADELDGDTSMTNAMFTEETLSSQTTQDEHMPLRHALVHSLSSKGCVSLTECKSVLDALQQDRYPDWQDRSSVSLLEARQAGVTLKVYLEQKLSAGAMEDVEFALRLTNDYPAQESISRALLEAFRSWSAGSELDPISRACSTMLNSDHDIVRAWLMFVSPSSIMAPLTALLDRSKELLQAGEEPSAIGSIVLFGQIVVQQSIAAGLTINEIIPQDHLQHQQQHIFTSLVRSASKTKPLKHFSKVEQEITANWIESLFGSDGISDDLIRSSSPQLLLSITPTLFSQTISASLAGLLDETETLRGGLTYFLQDLLSYTLPSAIGFLLNDVERCASVEKQALDKSDAQRALEMQDAVRTRKICLDILCFLLRSDNCPKAVHALVAQRCVSVLSKCETLLSDDAMALLADIRIVARQQQYVRRSDLWIKVTQATISHGSSPNAMLINVNDILFFSILTQKGVDAVANSVRQIFALHHVAAQNGDDDDALSVRRTVSFALTLMTLRRHFFAATMHTHANATFGTGVGSQVQRDTHCVGLPQIDILQIACLLLSDAAVPSAALKALLEQVAAHIDAIASSAIQALLHRFWTDIELDASLLLSSSSSSSSNNVAPPTSNSAKRISEAIRGLLTLNT